MNDWVLLSDRFPCEEDLDDGRVLMSDGDRVDIATVDVDKRNFWFEGDSLSGTAALWRRMPSPQQGPRLPPPRPASLIHHEMVDGTFYAKALRLASALLNSAHEESCTTSECSVCASVWAAMKEAEELVDSAASSITQPEPRRPSTG